MPIAETDLYPPLRAWLEQQGYTVRAEVHHCDVAAARGDELVLIELKRSLTLALLAQAARRQKATPSVYVALPRPAHKQRWLGQHRDAVHLLRRLELGLLLIGLAPGKPPVEVLFHPTPFQQQRRRRLQRAVLAEMGQRSGDYNQGGSTRRKLMTAYRENAIHLACCLQRLGPSSPKALRALGTGEQTRSILYRNVYGWFERVDRGVYALSAQGAREIKAWPEIVERYNTLP